MDHIERQDTSSSNSSRGFSINSWRENGTEAKDADVRGPLGLNTLYDPYDAVIADIIFVHGLRGGSKSTWSKDHDPALYWPQEWLPKEEGFRDVRIHSFGYNSNWEKESTLNIHDFAKSLLGYIHDSPVIPRDLNVCYFIQHFCSTHPSLW
jgi:hypothetical protein